MIKPIDCKNVTIKNTILVIFSIRSSSSALSYLVNISSSMGPSPSDEFLIVLPHMS